jgi:hypothetical protein
MLLFSFISVIILLSAYGAKVNMLVKFNFVYSEMPIKCHVRYHGSSCFPPALASVKLFAAALLLVTVLIPAQAQQRDFHIRLTSYNKSLGAQRVADIDDISFPGKIVVSGKIRIEPDEPDGECSGACAYFLPDRSSQKQLPGIIVTPKNIIRIDRISLYDASPVLTTLLGPRQAKALLNKHVVYELPGTFVLQGLHIFIACGSINYEAKVVRKVSVSSYIALTDPPQQYGC